MYSVPVERSDAANLTLSEILWKDTVHVSCWMVFPLQAISLRIKIPYTLFLLVFIPVYWIRYGPENFLWFSDFALFGTLAALWVESSLLASMMTVGVLMFDVIWCVVFVHSLMRGGSTDGLVGYMFDPQVSLFIRTLSLFRVALPVVQLWTLNKLAL